VSVSLSDLADSADFDVAVLGGGLAGFCAARAAAAEGARVVLIRRGLAATAMFSGGFDFPAVLPLLYGTGRFGAAGGASAVGGAGGAGGAGAASAASAPGGASAPSGAGGTGEAGPTDPTGVMRAAATLADWLASVGVELVGRPGEVLRLLDTAGNVRSTNLAPAAIALGRVDQWGDRRVLFLGVEGYPLYNPEWVARKAVWLGLARPEKVAAAEVTVPGLDGEASLAAPRVAEILDRPAAAEAFAAAVARAARKAGAELVALPPVLGLRDPAGVFAAVNAALGAAGGSARTADGGSTAGGAAGGSPGAEADVRAFELLATPPSVPGQRLRLALERLALEAGVVVIDGRVTGPGGLDSRPGLPDSGPGASGSRGAFAVGAAAAPKVLHSVRVSRRGREFTVRASEFVLATGSFYAGGLAAERQRVREPVFGLTVYGPPRPGWPPGELPVEDRPVREMVWDRFDVGHPVFEVGLAVDEELRPLAGGSPAWSPVDGLPRRPTAVSTVVSTAAERHPAFLNLRAAGSIIGGYPRTTGSAGAGVAVVTGLAAGRLAALAALKAPGSPGEPSRSADKPSRSADKPLRSAGESPGTPVHPAAAEATEAGGRLEGGERA